MFRDIVWLDLPEDENIWRFELKDKTYILLPLPFLNSDSCRLGFAISENLDLYPFARFPRYINPKVYTLYPLQYSLQEENLNFFIKEAYDKKIKKSNKKVYQELAKNLIFAKVREPNLHKFLQEILEDIQEDKETLTDFLFSRDRQNRPLINYLSSEDLFVLGRDIEGTFKYLLKNSYNREVKKLKEKLDVDIDEEIIQEVYEYFFKNDMFNKARVLKKNFKVHPNKRIIEESYDALFLNNDVEGIIRLNNFGKIKPPNEKMQMLYSSLLRENIYNIYKAIKLGTYTKIKPEEEIVKNAYNFYFHNNCIWCAENLFKWTKIKPQKNKKMVYVVQSLHDKLLKDLKIDDARELEKWTGVRPSKDTVNNTYKLLFKKGDMENIYKLRRLSGLSPYIDESEVRLLYKKLKSEGDIFTAKTIEEWTGVKINSSEH